MSKLRQLFSANRKAKAYTANVTTAPLHNLSGRDSHSEGLALADKTESSFSDTLLVGDANYIYYRLYAMDGAIPSKTPAAPGDPFLGRIKATSVRPPHTVHTVRCSIARAEGIQDPANANLFLTPYSQSPMPVTGKVILNRNGLGSTPQEPLAFVARISESERSALESGVAAEHDTSTTPLEVQYLYYRLYTTDGAIPSKAPAPPGDPFLGRINVTSVPPPLTVHTLRCSIARVEDIKDPADTNLFLTPYSQSPIPVTDKVILNSINGLGSTPQEPIAFVALVLDSERSAAALESEVAALPDTTPLEIRYLYYLLYANDYEKPSNVVFDPENPSLGRIRADSVAPPHSLATIKRCISRAERTPALVHADIFLDISSDTPLKEGHISILRTTDCPALSPKKPMAISLDPSLPDGRYFIKNRAADIYWSAARVNDFWTVHFRKPALASESGFLKKMNSEVDWQWDITHDTNGNISMKARCHDWWRGVSADSETTEIKLKKTTTPWRLIRVDSKFYYLMMDFKSQVAAAQPDASDGQASIATMKEGDRWQMWEFIQVRE